jgi:hypothetical protein
MVLAAVAARPWPGAIPVVRECFTEHHQGGTLDGGNLAETTVDVNSSFELFSGD